MGHKFKSCRAHHLLYFKN